MTKFKSLFEQGKTVEVFGNGLKDRFGIPPFTVLDARSGEWQSRKAAWLALGIKSELGRGENLLRFSNTILEPDKKKREARKASAIPGGGTGKNSAYMFKTDKGYKSVKQLENNDLRGKSHSIRTTTDPYRREGEEVEGAGASGTSIFDPVLCEMFYRWFVPPGGSILDPFAGGSVRGIVAGKLGFDYGGFDLRKEQVKANRDQASAICSVKEQPRWTCDDAKNVRNYIDDESVDAIFSCPPYVNLEQYSDDPRDLSTLEWSAFEKPYRTVINEAARCLKDNRFAAFVVGEVRDKKEGHCVGFVPGTIRAFESAGLRLYNDAILLTSVGSLAMRAGKQFAVTRKLGRSHQYMLIFCKGDPRKAVAAIEGTPEPKRRQPKRGEPDGLRIKANGHDVTDQMPLTRRRLAEARARK